MSDLKLYRRPGSDIWQVRGTVTIPDRARGVLVRQSSGTSRLDEAKVFRDRLRKQAERIQEAANEAISEAEDEGVGGAVNWSDCGVIDVEMSLLNPDYSLLCVVIAEASPDATELQVFVRQYLEAHGLSADVRTEW